MKCLKGPGQVICDGCQQYFCLKHLPEHRQELSQRMDELTLEHDELQRNLTEESDDQPHPLFSRSRSRESNKCLTKLDLN